MKHQSKYLTERQNRMLGVSTITSKKPVKPIAKRTNKGKALDRELNKIKKEMLAESTECELQTPVCIHVATILHHSKRRGVNLLNKKYLKRSCEPCNGWVESHPVEALRMQLLVSKFS